MRGDGAEGVVELADAQWISRSIYVSADVKMTPNGRKVGQI